MKRLCYSLGVATIIVCAGAFTLGQQNPAQRPQEGNPPGEAQASKRVRQELGKIRKEITEQKLTFTVGVTGVSEMSIDTIAGTRIPEPAQLKQIATGQNALASTLLKIDDDALKAAEPNFRGKFPELTHRCSPTAAKFDWRTEGKSTGVRNQLACGSCWVHAALGAYEGNYLIRNGGDASRLNTSEQDVMDCGGPGDCGGGWWMDAWNYLIATGTASEAARPYTGHDTSCVVVPRPYRAVAWGFVEPSGGTPTVKAMKEALCRYGPLAVAVTVGSEFQHYTGGVFNFNATGSVNHGVTLIGWDDAKGAWLIKNSWGTAWGETGGMGTQKGYMWIKYGVSKIGYAAGWCRAQARFYILPRPYFDALKFKVRPFPEPGPIANPPLDAHPVTVDPAGTEKAVPPRRTAVPTTKGVGTRPSDR